MMMMMMTRMKLKIVLIMMMRILLRMMMMIMMTTQHSYLLDHSIQLIDPLLSQVLTLIELPQQALDMVLY